MLAHYLLERLEGQEATDLKKEPEQTRHVGRKSSQLVERFGIQIKVQMSCKAGLLGFEVMCPACCAAWDGFKLMSKICRVTMLDCVYSVLLSPGCYTRTADECLIIVYEWIYFYTRLLASVIPSITSSGQVTCLFFKLHWLPLAAWMKYRSLMLGLCYPLPTKGPHKALCCLFPTRGILNRGATTHFLGGMQQQFCYFKKTCTFYSLQPTDRFHIFYHNKLSMNGDYMIKS